MGRPCHFKLLFFNPLSSSRYTSSGTDNDIHDRWLNVAQPLMLGCRRRGGSAAAARPMARRRRAVPADNVVSVFSRAGVSSGVSPVVLGGAGGGGTAGPLFVGMGAGSVFGLGAAPEAGDRGPPTPFFPPLISVAPV